MPVLELPTFLISWRKKLCHALSEDPGGHLGRKYTALAHAVSDTFPNPTTLLRYTAPLTSWSDGGQEHEFSELKPKQPDIARLASLCERFFTWGTTSGILEKFDHTIWDGACLRMLTEVRAKPDTFASSTDRVTVSSGLDDRNPQKWQAWASNPALQCVLHSFYPPDKNEPGASCEL
jgi:hypothetical protein